MESHRTFHLTERLWPTRHYPVRSSGIMCLIAFFSCLSRVVSRSDCDRSPAGYCADREIGFVPGTDKGTWIERVSLSSERSLWGAGIEAHGERRLLAGGARRSPG